MRGGLVASWLASASAAADYPIVLGEAGHPDASDLVLGRQNQGVPERLLTPSKITAWLDCPHFLTLRHEVDNGVREQPPHMFGEMAQMLMDKGIDHELQVLARYEAAGRTVHRVPERAKSESFAAWAGRVGGALSGEHDVLYQLPLVQDGIRGVADFLERVVDDDGRVTYEPVDAKLARSSAKPGHVLQLCFYAEAIAAQTGCRPEQVHIELGSGAGSRSGSRM